MHQKIKFIPMKIHKIVTTRAAYFGPDMHQIVCRLGLCPRPHWGSLQRSSRPLAGLRGPTFKGGEGMEGKGRIGEGRGGKRKGGEGRGGEEWQPQRLPRVAQMLAPPLSVRGQNSPSPIDLAGRR